MSMMAELAVEQLTNGHDRFGVGGNHPPGPLDSGMDAVKDLSSFLAENPVITSEEQARAAKLFVDRMRATLGDIEDTRIRLVKPLNDEVTAINERFKSFHNTDPKKPGTGDRVHNELKSRLTAFARAEEERKAKIAAELQAKKDEAERLARAAEDAEREAIANARAGELGVDVTQVVIEADNAFADFKLSSREAARAERDVNTRIGGGFSGRALSMRNKETLQLDSYSKAITAIGPNDKIRDAIISAARDYRKLHGELPAGVSAVTERTI